MRSDESSSKKKINIFIFTLFLLVCSTILYAYFEARNIELVRLRIEDKDIPESFVGTKIVFVSDIHCGKYSDHEDIRKLVDRINDLEPDIILLGGDNVSGSIYVDTFFSEIGRLNSTYGVYTVLGNHDHWADPKRIQQGFIDSGFNVCDNQSFWIRNEMDSIKIGGIGDLWCDDQIINNTIDDVNADDFCILLSHQPDFVEEIEYSDKIDIMLSGHTHAGQITLFGLWAPIMPGATRPDLETTKRDYKYGWIRKNNVILYVTSGIGMSGIPFRFFAQPEIVEFTLKRPA